AGIELFERASPAAADAGPPLEEQIAAGNLPTPDDEIFAGVYIELLDRLAPELRTILELALDSPTRPLLFHCVAGKDRTGIAAALLLGLLGVPDSTILDDYELTSAYYTAGRMQALADLVTAHGASPEHVRDVLSPRRQAMAPRIPHLR